MIDSADCPLTTKRKVWSEEDEKSRGSLHPSKKVERYLRSQIVVESNEINDAGTPQVIKISRKSSKEIDPGVVIEYKDSISIKQHNQRRRGQGWQ